MKEKNWQSVSRNLDNKYEIVVDKLSYNIINICMSSINIYIYNVYLFIKL